MRGRRTRLVWEERETCCEMEALILGSDTYLLLNLFRLLPPSENERRSTSRERVVFLF